jgi:hypothetical protein
MQEAVRRNDFSTSLLNYGIHRRLLIGTGSWQTEHSNAQHGFHQCGQVGKLPQFHKKILTKILSLMPSVLFKPRRASYFYLILIIDSFSITATWSTNTTTTYRSLNGDVGTVVLEPLQPLDLVTPAAETSTSSGTDIFAAVEVSRIPLSLQ